MESLTVNQIAESGTDWAPAARQVQVLLPLVLGDDAQGLLDEPVGPVTQKVLHALKQCSRQDKQTDDLLIAVCSLRGAVAAENDERPSIPYEEDILTLDMNDMAIPTYVVPMLHDRGLGPPTLGEITTEKPAFPVHGALYGYNRRPFFTLTLERDDFTVQLPIFVNTGGQETTLNETSFKKLAPRTDFSNWNSTRELLVKVHGIQTGVKLGHGRTAGVNMVGCQWLERAGLALVVDYSGLGCMLLNAAAERAHPALRTYS